MHGQVKPEYSQRILRSSGDSKNSKSSLGSFAKKKSPSKRKDMTESSVRLFKDITHKMQEENTYAERSNSKHNLNMKSVNQKFNHKQKVVL